MRKPLVLILSAAIFSAALISAYFVAHSPLFLIQVVEILNPPDDSPIDSQKIAQLAAVPVGKINLFELDLDLVEQRVLTESWIREVNIQKRFPQTLSISVTYRKPRALIQLANGTLSYVDNEGKIFGKVNMNLQPDLPVLSGFVGEDQLRVLDAVHLLDAWDKAPTSNQAELASVMWDSERGFRVLLSYPVLGKRSRTIADLGQEADAELEQQLNRLAKVISYLSTNSIAARQVWADAGKKIVVKTAKGS